MIIILSSKKMYSLLGEYQEGEIIVRNGDILHFNEEVISVGCSNLRDWSKEFRFKITGSQMKKLKEFLKILEEQPVSLNFDTEHNWIWIREAILD
jgi:hypothetical protein